MSKEEVDASTAAAASASGGSSHIFIISSNDESSGSGGSTTTTTTKTATTTKRKRNLMICFSIPVAFYALYGLVASTRDLIGIIRGAGADVVGGREGGSRSVDHFDGTFAAEIPESSSSSSSSSLRATSPLFGLFTRSSSSSAAQADDQSQSTQSQSAQSIGIKSYLENVASPHSHYNPSTQVPFLWTPGAPNFMATKLLHCVPGLVQASWLGAAEEGTHRDQDGFEATYVGVGNARGGAGYLDVDMSTLHGVERARDQHLIESGLTNLIASPFLPEILDLYAQTNGNIKARAILYLVDHKHRIQFSYKYMHGQGLFTGTYLEFISSDNVLVNDYLVRTLSGKWDTAEELNHDDLSVAVQELQSKFHVGVARHSREFVASLASALGWGDDPIQITECMFPDREVAAHPPPVESALDREMSEIVVRKNKWDMQLMNIFVKRWEDGTFS